MIRCVFFDLDDTLYDYEAVNAAAAEALVSALSTRCDIPADTARAAYRQGREDVKARLPDCAARHNRLLYIQRALERLGRPPAIDAIYLYNIFWDYMLEHIAPRDGVLETLAFCRERGIQVGICTDLTAHIQHRKLERLRLADWVDCLVTSEEAGVEKPSPGIFQLCLEKSGVPAGETLFVGDSYEKDYLGARMAGIKPLLLVPEPDRPIPAEVDAIRSISEVKDWVTG